MFLAILLSFYWSLPNVKYDERRQVNSIKNLITRESQINNLFSKYRFNTPELHPQVQKVKQFSKNRKDKQQIIIRVLALRVEFQEEIPDDPRTTGTGQFSNTSNGEQPILGIDCNGRPYYNPYYDPPHDWTYFNNQMRALASYIYAATFGKVRLEWVVKPDSSLPAYKVPHTIAYYGDPDNMELGLVTFMRDAFRSADEDPTVNFEDLDNNGIKDYLEGILVKYIIFHAGSAWQTDVVGDTPYDLAAVTIPAGAVEYYLGRSYLILNEGRDTVYDACILPETMSQDGMEVKLQGTLFHESGHNLFLLPDLYDTYGRGAGIGAFGIMTTGPYLEASGVPSGIIPPLPNAWEKLFMDWILKVIFGEGFLDERVVDEIIPGPLFQEITVFPLQIAVDSFEIMKTNTGLYYVRGNFFEDPYSKPRIIKVPINSKEYFLIQNLQTNYEWNDYVSCGDTIKVSGRWSNGVVVDFRGENDFLLPGDGLLVFHIDEDIIWRNFASNTVNAVRPMGVWILEGDRVMDFQRFNWDFYPYAYCWFGSPYDLYFEGNNTLITPYTYPSTNDNYGNKTWINIYDVSPRGYAMSFKIKLEKSNPGFPTRIGWRIIDSTSTRMVFDEPYESYFETKDSLIFVLQNVYRKSLYFSTLDTTILDSFGLVNVIDRFGFPILSDTLRNLKFSDIPAVEDINQDGYLDFASVGTNRTLILYTTKDSDGNSIADRIFVKQLPEEIVSAPSIFEFTGEKIISVGALDNKYYLYKSNGELLYSFNTGAPARNVPATNGSLLYYQSTDGRMLILTDRFEVYTVGSSSLVPQTLSSPTILFDTTSMEIKVITVNGEGKVIIYDASGAQEMSRRYHENPQWNIAVGDVDGDGFHDYVFYAGGSLFALNKELNLISGFPKKVKEEVVYQPLLADVDGDGFEEIILPTSTGIHVYGFLQNDSLNYFPVSKGMNSHAVFAKIENEETLKLIYITSDGMLFSHNIGSLKSSWKHYGGNANHNPIYYLIPYESETPEERSDVNMVYVYPNPVFTPYLTLRFKANGSGKLDVNIYSFSGQRIKSATFNFSGDVVEEKQIFVGDMGPDVYFLNATFNFGEKKVQKILKFIVGKKE